jgi:hypothetical protein
MRVQQKQARTLHLPLRGETPYVEPRHRAAGIALSAALVLSLALLPAPLAVRALLGAALFVALVVTWSKRVRARAEGGVRAWIAVDALGVERSDEVGKTKLARWDQPFGVVLLTNPKRSRALLAFTTPDATRYVRVRIGSDAPAAVRELLARGSTVVDADALGDEDSNDPALAAHDALRLAEVIERASPSAFDRVFLTDSRGTPIRLDAHELWVGERAFDLDEALEWRGFMFHASVGHVITIYQATWVKQGSGEIVFVAQLPAEAPSWMVGRTPSLVNANAADNRAIVRDLRLMQSVPDLPPPREQRVAIERLFVLPLRRALDRAPRLSRAPAPSRSMPPAGGGSREPRA